jgi:hypothetical protein
MGRSSLDVEFPIDIFRCEAMLKSEGSRIGGWEFVKQDTNRHRLEWRYSFPAILAGTFKMSVTAVCTLRDDDTTSVHLEAILHDYDLEDKCRAALQSLVLAMQRKLDARRAELARIGRLVSEALVCPKCGGKLEAGSAFCPRDGTQVSQRCPKCGHFEPPSALFCSVCGQNLTLSR